MKEIKVKKEDAIVIKGDKISIWHDLKNLSNGFRFVKCYQLCMAREKQCCIERVEEINRLLEKLLT